MTAQRRASFVSGLVSLVALAITLVAAPARAQVQAISPYFGVVTSDDALLRSDGRESAYPVGKLTKGQLLRIDAEGQGWARVSYPPGSVALVPSDSFNPDAGGKGGMVTKATKLKAFNMTTGVRGSWKDALENALPSGAKLTLVDPQAVTDTRGSWYRVTPPEAARGFVQLPNLRRATDDEINAAVASQATRTETSKPLAGSPGVKPSVGPNGQAAAPGQNLTEPMVPPKSGEQPPTAPATGIAGATGSTSATPVAPRAVEIPPSPYEKLEAAFEAVRKQPTEQAEYGELTAEIQKAIDGLDDSPQSKMIRGRLQQRLDYLKLVTDLREQKRKLAEAQGGFKENDELIRKRLEEMDRVRQYTIVGRLSASTLYDGERLPLMYRIQTVGGPNPRTLAYVKPDPKLGIDSKLGQIVGVLGGATMDPTLRLNVITPVRVDVLEPASLESAPTPTNSAGATGATGGTAPTSKPPTSTAGADGNGI